MTELVDKDVKKVVIIIHMFKKLEEERLNILNRDVEKTLYMYIWHIKFFKMKTTMFNTINILDKINSRLDITVERNQ